MIDQTAAKKEFQTIGTLVTCAWSMGCVKNANVVDDSYRDEYNRRINLAWDLACKIGDVTKDGHLDDVRIPYIEDATLLKEGNDTEQLWKIGVLFSGSILSVAASHTAEDKNKPNTAVSFNLRAKMYTDQCKKLIAQFVERKLDECGWEGLERWCDKRVEEIENE